MAATAVYTKVVHIQRFDGKTTLDLPITPQSNVGTTSANFTLHGGQYSLQCKASTYGTVTLQILLPDGTTWATAATAFSADGVALATLPSGTYRLAVA